MSDGLKTGLIIGGAALAGFLIWKNSQAAVGLSTTSGTSTSASAPGAPMSPAPTPPPGTKKVTTSGSGGPSVSGAATVVGKVLAAPVVVPTLIAVKTGEAVAHGVVSIGKSIASIF